MVSFPASASGTFWGQVDFLLAADTAAGEFTAESSCRRVLLHLGQQHAFFITWSQASPTSSRASSYRETRLPVATATEKGENPRPRRLARPVCSGTRHLSAPLFATKDT